jgi:enoyl-CoA hydratase
MPYEHLVLAIHDRVATVTIDRPEVQNALDLQTWHELGQVVHDAALDDRIHVMIITGAGDKAFAAGTDIAWLRDRSVVETLQAYSQGVLCELENMWKPTVAAVNGYALGGGCELAMACDIRVASDQAKFGQPEVRLGIIPGAGGTQRLPRLVGVAKAKELIFTGAIIDALEAEKIGLVNKVVPHEQLMSAALELVNKIIERGPLAVRLAKAAVNAGVDSGPGAGMAFERLAQALLFTTEDRVEGTSAFLQKRRPEFKGR